MSGEALFSGRSRQRSMQQFLAVRPHQGECVVVQLQNPETQKWDTLCRYGHEQVTADLAVQIDEMVHDTVSELRHASFVRMCWHNAQGEILQTKPMHYRTPQQAAEETRYEGTAASVLVQMQEHQQKLMETLRGCVEYTVMKAADAQERSIERVAQVEAELVTLRQENERLNEELMVMTARGEIDKAVEESEDPIAKRMGGALEAYGAMWLQQQMAKKAAAPKAEVAADDDDDDDQADE